MAATSQRIRFEDFRSLGYASINGTYAATDVYFATNTIK